MRSFVFLVSMTFWISLSFFGCSKDLDKALNEADSLAFHGKVEEAVQQLRDMEVSYAKDTTAILRLRAKMVDLYGGYAGDYRKAAALLAETIDRYPDRPETAANLFKLAFTYETVLKDLNKARELYNVFLQRYPNHELSVSVKVNLEHLGESEEEMLTRIIEKAQKDSARKGRE